MKHHRKKIIVFTLLTVVLTCIIGGFVYVSNYYHATEEAKGILEESMVIQSEDVIELTNETSTTGFIFYPGGKVEATAYLPLLDKLREEGIAVFLVEMPFNLAVFNPGAAELIIANHPEITSWYIGGHSLGGAMASSYYDKHPERFDGLILLGAYIYGDVQPTDALTIYGSEDKVLNRDKISYTTNVFVIDGGNHAGFGNYGMQKGDGIASITNDEQQDETVKHIVDFIQAFKKRE